MSSRGIELTRDPVRCVPFANNIFTIAPMLTAGQHLRIDAGQCDPADPSAFTIPYDLDSTRHTVYFRLNTTNAVDLIAIDAGWTRQEKILPMARKLLSPGGIILTLIKPHYESEEAKKSGGVLAESESIAVLERVAGEIEAMGFSIAGIVKSPIEGQKGNVEFVACLS